jgi:glycerate 2-kinase
MRLNPERFMTASLHQLAWGEKVARVMATAVHAVDPAAAVHQSVQRQGSLLIAGGRSYDLQTFKRVWVVGAGKAGAPMAVAVQDLLGQELSGGVVVVKDGHELVENAGSMPKIRILSAGHPVPDERGVTAAQQISALMEETNEDDLVICLISGGGSALLTSPAGGLRLEQIQGLTSALLASGADIQEINTLRKHLDAVKGGGLARLAYPAHTLTLILSDVVGDHLDVIASGPTAPDPTTFETALRVLEKYGLVEKTPGEITDRLRRGMRGEISDTPGPEDPVFQRVQNLIIGSNLMAARAALTQAESEGFTGCLLTTRLQGEARQAGAALAEIARQARRAQGRLSPPVCLVAGGETTVTLRGAGTGGRNQEMALAAVVRLDGLPDLALITLATDGGDGPTPAAGAVVTGETYRRARSLGMDPVAYLERNDSHRFFQGLGDALTPGPTLTNVNDLAFIFIH